mmetsp:Transcript_25468/g.64143  ORF Transcript_25468/g.64143 Transcript_25468/m.64143 type:complete len:245 (-) Transcript_25468:549-1283(-)
MARLLRFLACVAPERCNSTPRSPHRRGRGRPCMILGILPKWRSSQSTGCLRRYSTLFGGSPCPLRSTFRRPNQRPCPESAKAARLAAVCEIPSSCKSMVSSTPPCIRRSTRSSRSTGGQGWCNKPCPRNLCLVRRTPWRPNQRRRACGNPTACKSKVWSRCLSNPCPLCTGPCMWRNPGPSRSTACRFRCSTGNCCNPRHSSSTRAPPPRRAHPTYRSSKDSHPGRQGPDLARSWHGTPPKQNP